MMKRDITKMSKNTKHQKGLPPIHARYTERQLENALRIIESVYNDSTLPSKYAKEIMNEIIMPLKSKIQEFHDRGLYEQQ